MGSEMCIRDSVDIGLSRLSNLQIISSYAFQNSGLTTAVLSNTIQTVGVKAFTESSIVELTINCMIDNDLCKSCRMLKTLTLGEGVTSVGPYAFSGCSSLTGFTIPRYLRKIYDFAFESCSSLSYVGMVANCNLESVEGGCFYGCVKLKSINLSIYK